MSMEQRFNIHIYTFDDLDMLKGAVESIPDDVKIYVVDGRYCDFPGEYDLTPGLKEWCGRVPNIEYYSPSDDMLPFGEGGSSEHRDSNYEKACWVNYKILPQDQWTIQMDTDERLIHINRDVFKKLEDENQYRPIIPIDDGRTVSQPRVRKPGYWSFWIDDCAVPRSMFGRDGDAEKLHKAWTRYRNENMENIKQDDILIKNFGMSRPEEYQERRLNHLKEMGRRKRVRDLRESMANRDNIKQLPEDGILKEE